ncbi:leucine-rich repeat-containing protein 24 isoform X2 [Esox lucius]|uniref:leucine-rich repeat-containing protein 24 isoform X2 n=1 Tax=Esox lucius TaxID=8010 RepID=UPI000577EC8E|nr:leucine-rich repeat-containing protein 24 isoform X2 [Esox lucius]
MFLSQVSRLLLLFPLLFSGGCVSCPSECRCYSLTVECGSLGLRHIPQRVPDNTQTIFLQDNAVVKVTGLDLSGLGQLLYLYLQNNSISALEPGAFLGQGVLLELALNGNLIHLLTPDTFTGLDHLRILYLAANQITRLHDHTFTGLQRLQELHLQENSIEALGDQALSGLSSLALLDLSRNQLRTLGQAVLRPVISLEVLRVTENPWRCDCALHWLRLWIDAEGQRLLSWSERRLLCAEPPRLVHLSLLEVAPNSLVCIPPVLHLEASQLTVPLGGSLKVSCQASGYPQPLVTWRKTSQGRALLGPSGLLQELGGERERNRRREQGGGHMERREEERWEGVRIEKGGHIERARPESGRQEEGREVLRGKTEMRSRGGGDVQGVTGEGEEDTGSGMLFLSNVTVAHAGRYECEAWNPGGVAHLTFHLAVNMTSSTDLWPQLHSSSSPVYPGQTGVSQEPLYEGESMDFSALSTATQTVIAVGISLLSLTALLLLFMIYSRQQQHKQVFVCWHQTGYSSSSKDGRILYVNDYSDGPTTFSQLEEYCDEAGHEMYVLNSSRPAQTTHSGLLANQHAGLLANQHAGLLANQQAGLLAKRHVGLLAKQQRVLVLQEALQAQGQVHSRVGCLGSQRAPVEGLDVPTVDPGDLLLNQSLLYDPQMDVPTVDPGDLLLNQSLLYDPQMAYEIHC